MDRGFKAVGKTDGSAMKVWEMCLAYVEAGAFGVEIEVVRPKVTAEISKRTSLFMVSTGGGLGGDAQYLFAFEMSWRCSGSGRRSGTGRSDPWLQSCGRAFGLQPLKNAMPAFFDSSSCCRRFRSRCYLA